MKQDIEKTAEVFTNPGNPLDLIVSWENLAKQEKLDIEITPAAIEKYKSDRWDFLGFKITLSGDFISIQKFIEAIENSKYLLEINNLAIRKNSSGQSLNEAAADILLKAYTNNNGG